MKRLLIIALLVGLGGCNTAEAPPPAPADVGWRTSSGTPLSSGEVEALRASCDAGPRVASVDTDQPVANPLRDNPVYHPGGEGLANAPPVGIAAAGRRVEPTFRRIAAPPEAADDECLMRQGLIRAR